VNRLSTLLIVIVAFINLAPVTGALSVARMESLYGIEIAGADLEVLMRHRAFLFSIVGGLILASAFHRPLRAIGLVVGLTNMLSFIVIAWMVGGHDREIGRVAMIDAVAIVALIGSALIDRFTPQEEVAQ
jgi:hypothetical protein